MNSNPSTYVFSVSSNSRNTFFFLAAVLAVIADALGGGCRLEGRDIDLRGLGLAFETGDATHGPALSVPRWKSACDSIDCCEATETRCSAFCTDAARSCARAAAEGTEGMDMRLNAWCGGRRGAGDGELTLKTSSAAPGKLTDDVILFQ